jgi:transcriptional regulator with XRE-family HTH domain
MLHEKPGPESTIGGRIAQARFQRAAKLGRNVTQAWLAQEVGVSGPTVSQWESGITEPTISSLAKIAKALGVDAGYLAFGASEPTAAPRARVDYGRRSTATPADAPLMAQPTPAKKRA